MKFNRIYNFLFPWPPRQYKFYFIKSVTIIFLNPKRKCNSRIRRNGFEYGIDIDKKSMIRIINWISAIFEKEKEKYPPRQSVGRASAWIWQWRRPWRWWRVWPACCSWRGDHQTTSWRPGLPGSPLKQQESRLIRGKTNKEENPINVLNTRANDFSYSGNLSYVICWSKWDLDDFWSQSYNSICSEPSLIFI